MTYTAINYEIKDNGTVYQSGVLFIPDHVTVVTTEEIGLILEDCYQNCKSNATDEEAWPWPSYGDWVDIADYHPNGYGIEPRRTFDLNLDRDSEKTVNTLPDGVDLVKIGNVSLTIDQGIR